MADPSIYPPGVVNPTVPPEQDTPYPPMPDIPSNPPPGSVTIPSGGTAPMLPAALKWLGALFLLWVILTALSEHGDPNAKTIGRALAGLILFGAVYYLAPDKPDGTPGAITNAKKLITGG